MFPRLIQTQKKQQQSPQDESVRKEAQLDEDLKSVQPMGNEAANVELMDQMLKGSDGIKHLDLSDEYIDPGGGDNISLSSNSSESSRGKKRNIIIPPGLGDLDDSDYLNNSHNIVNENWLERIGENGNKNNIIISNDDRDDSSENDIIRNDSRRSITVESLYRIKHPDPGLLLSNDPGDENDIPETAPEEPKKKKDEKNASKEDMKAAIEIAEDIVQDQPKQEAPVNDDDGLAPLSTYAMEEDLVAEAGKKKKKKKKGKSSARANDISEIKLEGTEKLNKDYRRKKAAMERTKNMGMEFKSPEEEQAFLSEENEKIKNWDFKAQRLDKPKKPGKLRRLLTYTAAGMGKLLRTALQIVTLGHIWRFKSMASFATKSTDSWQLTKNYQNIPGWDGAKFSSKATKGEDVMADFRRVPTVWARLTAAKAAEKTQKDGEEVEKPLDPVVSVLIDQPKSGSAQTLEGGAMGHAMLGIEFSRKSAVSGRYERYKVQYGFYPAGSTTNFSGGMMEMRNNAILPGQLVDDYTHKYDVSRRYPAKPEQVSAIFRDSEKYAEGGYGYYDRNCTTFVKEMVVNTAHLATGGDIFKQSTVEFSHLANLGIFASEAFHQNINAGAETTLMDLSKREDQSYQNYGNKRATGRDWVNYKKSLEKGGSSLSPETFVPAEVGERMRRMQGDGTGEIGSFKYDDLLKDDNGNVLAGLTFIRSAIEKCASDIQLTFEQNPDLSMTGQTPSEFQLIANTLPTFGDPLDELDSAVEEKLESENNGKNENEQTRRADIREEYYVTPDQLRSTREALSRNITRINILLNDYLKNDKRIHYKMMNLISLLNHGINYVDDLYQKTVRGGTIDKNKGVSNVREEMTHHLFSVRAGGVETMFSPTHYESYIQIYKDPSTAIQKYQRLKDLRKKKKEHGKWTGSKVQILKHEAQSLVNAEDEDQLTAAERKELAKLERIESLALEFDNAHNYMIEKDQYSQQDIDYAFRMHDRETVGLETKAEVPGHQEDVSADVRDRYKSASGIYISIFMDKFFHGIKEQWMKGRQEGGIEENDTRDPTIVSAWLDNYLSDQIKKNTKGFQGIVRGIYRMIQARHPEQEVGEQEVLDEMKDVINNTVIDRNFNPLSTVTKEIFGSINMTNGIEMITNNKSAAFNKLISAMVKYCRVEGNEKELAKIPLYEGKKMRKA